MNIFVVAEHPVLAAHYLCDKHVVKMVVETAQILSTVSYLKGVYDKELYKPTHIHHPCVDWTKESSSNYGWVLLHGLALSNEYTQRYKKIHKTDAVLRKLEAMVFQVWPGACFYDPYVHSPFVQCMPEVYRGSDAIAAYRRFYKAEKAKFAKWRFTEPPEWWEDGKSSNVE